MTSVRQKQADMLKMDVKSGTMREDAEVSNRFHKCILQRRYYCYYVTSPGAPRQNIVVDVKVGEIWDSSWFHVLRLCEKVLRIVCSLLVWMETRKWAHASSVDL